MCRIYQEFIFIDNAKCSKDIRCHIELSKDIVEKISQLRNENVVKKNNNAEILCNMKFLTTPVNAGEYSHRCQKILDATGQCFLLRNDEC